MATGILVTERLTPQANANRASTRFNRVLMLGWSTAADRNAIAEVSSLADFQAKFPGARPSVVGAVAHFFANTSRGVLSFVSVRDPDEATTPADADDPAPTEHYSYAIAQLLAKQYLDAAIIVLPEFPDIAVQADRTSIYSAIQSVCTKHEMIQFIPSAIGTDTVAEVQAEAALYASELGHSAYYYGHGLDASDRRISAAVIGATIAAKRNSIESPYSPPAGARYPIAGINSYPDLVTASADYTTLNDANINLIQEIGKEGALMWGARTRSPHDRYQWINTRFVMSGLVRDLRADLLPFAFESQDPQGFVRSGALGAIVSRVTRVYSEGGLNGATVEESYLLQEEATATDGITKFKLFVRPVGTVELIEVDLYNVDTLPANS